MKFAVFLSLLLFSSTAFADVNLPRAKDFFKTEKVIRTFKIPGSEVRILSTAKDFETLKKELEKLLGEDWQVEDPKKPTEADEAGRKALGLSEDARVNYINPKNPKVKVALSLTKRPGLKAGEVRMFLTIVRDPKK